MVEKPVAEREVFPTQRPAGKGGLNDGAVHGARIVEEIEATAVRGWRARHSVRQHRYGVQTERGLEVHLAVAICVECADQPEVLVIDIRHAQYVDESQPKLNEDLVKLDGAPARGRVARDDGQGLLDLTVRGLVEEIDTEDSVHLAFGLWVECEPARDGGNRDWSTVGAVYRQELLRHANLPFRGELPLVTSRVGPTAEHTSGRYNPPIISRAGRLGSCHLHLDLHRADLHRDIDQLNTVSEELGRLPGLVALLQLANDLLHDRNHRVIGRLSVL